MRYAHPKTGGLIKAVLWVTAVAREPSGEVRCRKADLVPEQSLTARACSTPRRTKPTLLLFTSHFLSV